MADHWQDNSALIAQVRDDDDDIPDDWENEPEEKVCSLSFFDRIIFHKYLFSSLRNQK